MKISKIAAISFVAMLSACVTLSEKGAKVNYYTKQEPPTGCKQLPEMLSSSYNVDEGTLITDMRNKAGDMDANFMVLDTIVIKQNEHQPQPQYSGTGRAFKCP